MSKVSVMCGACKGTGEIPLTGRYAETLSLLRKQRTETNGAELAEMAGVNPTAMNNRLTALERYGLAIGRWDGRQRLWKAK